MRKTTLNESELIVTTTVIPPVAPEDMEDPIAYGQLFAAQKLRVPLSKVQYNLVQTAERYWYMVPAGLEPEFEKWRRTGDTEQFPVWAFCLRAN